MLTPRLRTSIICGALAFGAFVTLACGGGSSTAKLASTNVPIQEAVSTANADTTAPTAVNAEVAASEPTPAKQDFKVGEIINLEDLNIMVVGWGDIEPSDFGKPDAGNKFIAVEIVAVNAGTDGKSLSSILQTKLKDVEGQQYEPDFKAAIATNTQLPSGELASGERVRGTVGFQVPEQVGNLTFVYDASLFGSGKLFVDLGATPTTVEVPASIPGESPQKAFNVGEAIEMGKMVLTINEVASPEGSEYSKPKEGNKFIVVDLTLENKASEAANVSSMLQMNVKDANGFQYSSSFAATQASGGNPPDGEIAPGEKIKGQVGFEVPADAKGLLFSFDDNVFSSGKVFVTLP